MEITWYVEDGYANAGPHYLEIPDEELDGLSPKEQHQLIASYIQDEFENSVSWRCDIGEYLKEG